MRVLTHWVLWSLGWARAETQTTQAERDCLARHAAGRRVLVEIGVWHGVTTRRLRAAMAPDGVLFAVDPFPVGRLGLSFQRHIARREVSTVKNGEVQWIRLTGAEAGRRHAAARLPAVELLFVDGDHTYDAVKQDWQSWSGLISPGGVVGLHDSHPTSGRPIEDAGSVRFTQEVVLRDRRFTPIEVVDSLTMLRRNQT